jgi:alginate O-acetyltransferase complex protein AlgI
MLFNSLQFVYFFPLVIFFYFSLPHKFRWILLLAASYYFYMSWRVDYVGLMLASTIVAYLSAIKIEGTKKEIAKKLIFYSSLLFHLGILITFKYANFFAGSINDLFSNYDVQIDIPLLNVLLPIGISFYTFQIISYSIDVYSGEKKAERHFGIFSLYVSFFPQLVAGPIERSGNLLPQFFEKHSFNYKDAASGLRQIFWGLFKKVVIADRLAVLVDHVYANPTEFTGIALTVAAVFFVFQVYCDFSGYSDIAIGAAKVMGFRLTRNFNRPYSSRSISEYWRRWHITLTTWFNDYIFMPLVYRNRGWGVMISTILALVVTFSLSGLWHGANWTFIVFGMIHGVALCAEQLTRKERAFLKRTINPIFYSYFCLICIFTFICFVDVFFRASNINDAIYVVTNMVTGTFSDLQFLIDSDFSYRSILSLFMGLGLTKIEILIGIMLIIFLEVVQLIQTRVSVGNLKLWQRWSIYYSMGAAFLLLGSFNNSTQFIYFQF